MLLLNSTCQSQSLFQHPQAISLIEPHCLEDPVDTVGLSSLEIDCPSDIFIAFTAEVDLKSETQMHRRNHRLADFS